MIYSSTNQVQKVGGSGMLLPEAQPADDQLISEPTSVATSDQPEQFLTPQNSSPSLHSACNSSSQPTTPTSNMATEDTSGDTTSTNTGATDDLTETNLNTGLPYTQQPTRHSNNMIDADIDTDHAFTKHHSTSTSSSATVKDLASEPDAEGTLRHDTVTELTDHNVESDFVLVDHPEDFDVEGTLRPANLRTVAKSSWPADKDYDDALVPAHLRVVGVHGNGTGDISFYGNNMGSGAGVQIEDQVVGISDNTNFSVNGGPSTISIRRKSGPLPDLKLAKLAHGASSPEYYTPTDSTYVCINCNNTCTLKLCDNNGKFDCHIISAGLMINTENCPHIRFVAADT